MISNDDSFSNIAPAIDPKQDSEEKNIEESPVVVNTKTPPKKVEKSSEEKKEKDRDTP